MSRHSRRPGARRAPGHPSTRNPPCESDPQLFSRHLRLEQLLLEALRSLLGDGAADEALASVRPLTVELSVDGRRALVPYAVRGPLAEAARLEAEARSALERANRWLRGQLSELVTTKRSPELTFRFVGVSEEAE